MTQKSRRDFIRASSLLVATGAVTGGLGLARSAHAFGSDLIRVGLIGCGALGRQTAVRVLSTASGPVKLVAMADVFADPIQAAFRQIKSRCADRIDVPRERRFVGFEAYRDLLDTELDLVLCAAPPVFRPLHLEAAIGAGKHVFLEQPVAVDAPGVRRVLAAGAEARNRDLAIAAGLQHRHERAYREIIAHLQSGAAGDPITLRVYHNTSAARLSGRRPRESELEHQLRNSSCFRWLRGELIVERHVRNLDVGNWLLDAFPSSVIGHGGCDAEALNDGAAGRQGFSRFFCEFVYPDGTRMFSQCGRSSSDWNNISEHLHTTRGRADISGGKVYDLAGARIWRTKAPRDGKQQQHHDLLAALREGRIPNESDYAAKSTLTAIMGRMAAYHGRPVSWEQAFASEFALANVDTLVSLDDPAPAPVS